MAPKVELVYKAPLGCGEGPHWIAEEKALVFVDIPGHCVFRLDEKTGDVTKGVCEGTKDIGFAIPVRNNPGKYVVGADLKVCALQWDGGNADSLNLTEITSVQEADGNRFNDAKCDRSGRLWLGTMGKENGPGGVKKHTGNLYTLSKDKKLEVKVPNVSLSNGLAWSPDNSIFYYVDTCEHRIDAFDYDISTGSVSNRRPVYDLAAHYLDSLPDGLTIDANGKLWLATYLGKAVLHIDPETQKIIDTIEMPVPNITSCSWGGEQLDTLYVTTSARCSDFDTYPQGGSLFKITGLGTKGLPSDPIDIQL